MKICEKKTRNPKLTDINQVKFGSLIRLTELPDYWPSYYTKRKNHLVQTEVWVLSSEYFRSSGPDLLVMNPVNGHCMGLRTNTMVEVIKDAEVHTNENL